jgi:hypothetical protein
MPRNAPRPNRTDLNVPAAPGIAPQGQPNGIPPQVQPNRVPTGLPYGENQQLSNDQSAVPLPQAPGPPTGAGGPPSASPDFATALNAARQFTVPPNVAMMRKTDRPNEPVTAGLPGTAQNPASGARQVGSLSSMISAVAQASGSAALSQLAARAAAAGQ